MKHAALVYLAFSSALSFGDLPVHPIRAHEASEGSCPWLLGNFVRPSSWGGRIRKAIGMGTSAGSERTPIPEHDPLLSGIRHDPSQAAYSAYGDLLTEHGWSDAGEFIALQLEIDFLQRCHPEDDRLLDLETREKELARENRKRWIPAGIASQVRGWRFEEGVPTGASLDAGDRVRYGHPLIDRMPTLRHLSLRVLSLGDFPGLGHARIFPGAFDHRVQIQSYQFEKGPYLIYQLPSASEGMEEMRFHGTPWAFVPGTERHSSLRRLAIRGAISWYYDSPPPFRYKEFLANLEELELSELYYHAAPREQPERIGLLGHLGDGPDFHLRRLYLRASLGAYWRRNFETLFHRDQLEDLDLSNNGIRYAVPIGLFNSSWPRLERLNLAENRFDDSFLRELSAHSDRFPALRVLNLAGTRVTEAGVAAFLSGPRPKQLARLLVPLRLGAVQGVHSVSVYYHYRDPRLRRTPGGDSLDPVPARWSPARLLLLDHAKEQRLRSAP